MHLHILYTLVLKLTINSELCFRMLSKDELRSLIVQSGTRLAESAEFTAVTADLDKFVHRIDNIDGWWTLHLKLKAHELSIYFCVEPGF